MTIFTATKQTFGSLACSRKIRDISTSHSCSPSCRLKERRQAVWRGAPFDRLICFSLFLSLSRARCPLSEVGAGGWWAERESSKPNIAGVASRNLAHCCAPVHVSSRISFSEIGGRVLGFVFVPHKLSTTLGSKYRGSLFHTHPHTSGCWI